MEVVILFSDLADSERYRTSLRRPVEEWDRADIGSWILAHSAEVVEGLRRSSAGFARATADHPDSYWPLLVVVGSDDDRDAVMPDAAVWRTALGRTSFEVNWDFGILWASSDGVAEDLIDRTERLLAHWAELRAAIELTRAVVNRADASRSPNVIALNDELRERQLQLLGSLLRADQRSDCVWEYQVRFLTAARTAWDISDLEASAQTTIAAAHAHLDRFAERLDRQRAEQMRRGIATVRQLLLALTLLGGLATVVSIVEFAVDPESLSPRNIARVLLVLIALVVIVVSFRLLRRSATEPPEV